MNIIVIGILITVIMILYIIFAQFWMFICDTVLDVFEKFFPVDGKKYIKHNTYEKDNNK